MKNIIFIGFKGVGKTSVGRVVAKKLGKEFFDTDALIEQKFFEKEGRRLSFREIYKERGGAYFSQLDVEAAMEILKNSDSVISVGGGTLFSDGNLKDRIRGEKIVYIYVEPEKLFERITRRGLPPFLDVKNPKKSFDDLFSEREKLYRELAHITIDNSSSSLEETARHVVRILGREYGG